MGHTHFLIGTNRLCILDNDMLHFDELDKNDPVCEGGCQEGGHEASINSEEPKGRYLRVPFQLVNQDLGLGINILIIIDMRIFIFNFFLATILLCCGRDY